MTYKQSGLSRRDFVRLGGGTVIAGGLAAALAGCAGLPFGTPQGLRVGTVNFRPNKSVDPITGNTIDGLDSILTKFASSNPARAVEPIGISGASSNAVIAKIQTLLMGDAIDVLQGNTLWPFFEQGLLEDLTPYIQRDDWNKKSLPAMLEPPQERFLYPPMTLEPTAQLAVPGDLAVPSLAFDAELFEDFGVEPLATVPTIDEIIDKAAKLTGNNPRTGKACYAIGYDPRATAHIMLYYLGKGVDFGVVDPSDPSRLTLDTPQVLRGIEGMIDLAQYCPPGFQIGAGRENWGTKQNTVAINMVVYTGDMIAAIGNDLAKRFIVTEGLRNANDHTFLITGSEWAMAANTDRKDEAWELIKFLSGPEAQRLAFRNQLTLPSWRGADWVDPERLPYADQFLAAAGAAKNAFFPQFMFTTFRPWIAKVVTQAITGGKPDLQGGLADMQRKGEIWAATATPAGAV